MVLRTTNPFESLLKLQQALTNMAARESWFTDSISSRGGFPPINVFQDKDNYVLITEIPGIKSEDINVEVHHNEVRISGEKKIDYGSDVSIHRRERLAGSFDRTFSTPFEIDAGNVKAEYRDGILALYLPRAEHEKPRSVRVS